MILTNTPTYTHAPTGVHDAVCVDFIDIGPMDTGFGIQHQLKIVFEIPNEAGERPYTIDRMFKASMNEKAALHQFIAKWRGKPISYGEPIDLRKTVGTSALLVIGEKSKTDGSKVAVIDAISKATRRISPSGSYDPVKAREGIVKWARLNGQPIPMPKPFQLQPAGDPASASPATANPVKTATTRPAAPVAPAAKTAPVSPIADDDVPF